ncbi:hypothetical protein B0H11DRAFT_1942628 [Mycena galericulata]|nr:hypothetical protein B0H11DRAFT_1942628 [Mycena galericulata]
MQQNDAKVWLRWTFLLVRERRQGGEGAIRGPSSICVKEPGLNAELNEKRDKLRACDGLRRRKVNSWDLMVPAARQSRERIIRMDTPVNRRSAKSLTQESDERPRGSVNCPIPVPVEWPYRWGRGARAATSAGYEIRRWARKVEGAAFSIRYFGGTDCRRLRVAFGSLLVGVGTIGIVIGDTYAKLELGR